MNATKTNNWPATQLADEDFDFIRRLVYERSRISLGDDKKTLVASRLARRLQHLQLTGFPQYCEWLRSPAGDAELPFLIDRISTNHTCFFREMKHFDYLRETILPAWGASAAVRSETFRVWSAACSSGEEPYSLAIHLAEHLVPAESARWQIEASDISTRVLETAQRGIYEAGRLSSVEAQVLSRHFQKGLGEWAGHFRVKETLRRRIQFHHLNLLEGDYPFRARFQLILCRNVMIYFDRPTQESLISRLSEYLLPGGHLMVGHSESLSGIKHSLRPVQSAIFLKPA